MKHTTPKKMGCLKLAYYENKSPLKVGHRSFDFEGKEKSIMNVTNNTNSTEYLESANNDYKSLGVAINNVGEILGGSLLARTAFQNEKSKDEGGVAVNENIEGEHQKNLVFPNPSHFGKGNNFTFVLSASEVVTHEIGHNMAKVNKHGNGDYEYDQTGLQSNQSGQVYPTHTNTRNIINDKTNRQTLPK